MFRVLQNRGQWTQVKSIFCIYTVCQTKKVAWWFLCSGYWHLSESTRCDHIVHPFHSEASAQLDRLHVTFSSSGEGGEEEAHAESIFDITKSIDEGGVPATQKAPVKQSNILQHMLYRIITTICSYLAFLLIPCNLTSHTQKNHKLNNALLCWLLNMTSHLSLMMWSNL